MVACLFSQIFNPFTFTIITNNLDISNTWTNNIFNENIDQTVIDSCSYLFKWQQDTDLFQGRGVIF